MRRGRVLIYLALLLLVGVAAVVFLAPMIMNGGTNPPPDEALILTATPVLTVEVIVVRQPIALGTEITSDYLMTIPISQDSYVDGLYMTDMTKAVGRLARYDLQQGVWLNPSYLVDSLDQVAETVSELSFMIDKGKVAVSIPITRLAGVSYAPQRGDHVNVIVTLVLVDVDSEFQTKSPNFTAGVLAPGPGFLLGYSQKDETSANLTSDEKLRSVAAQVIGGGAVSRLGRALTDPLLEQTFYVIPSEEQRPRLVSQTLIQDVKVIHVGTYREKDKSQMGEDAITPTPVSEQPQQTQQATPEPERPDIITLVVTPQDAVTLNYLIYSGAQLTLALRPVGDREIVEQPNAVTLRFLLENYNIRRPEKLDIAVEPRVDKLQPPQLPNDNVQTTPRP